MAHFVTIETSAAGWASNRPVSQSDFWHFDESIGKAIDGDDGGTWSPTSPIVIGGSQGLRMNAPLNCTGAANFNGAVYTSANVTLNSAFIGLGNNSIGHYMTVAAVQTYSGSETHNGACTFNGQVTLGNNTSPIVIGGSAGLDVSADLSLSGYLYSTGGVDISAGTVFTCGATSTFTGSVSLGNNSTSDTLTVNAIETHNGAAGFLGNVVVGNNSSDTLQVYSTTQFEAMVGFVGDAQFNGDVALGSGASDVVTIADGADRANVELLDYSGGGPFTRNETSSNVIVCHTLGSGTTRVLIFTDTGGAGTRKFIKNASTGATLEVRQGSVSGRVLLTLTGNESGFIVRDSSALEWY